MGEWDALDILHMTELAGSSSHSLAHLSSLAFTLIPNTLLI